MTADHHRAPSAQPARCWCSRSTSAGAARCTVPVLPSTADLPTHGTDNAIGLSGIGLADQKVLVPTIRLGSVTIGNVEATRLAAGSPLPPLLGMTALGRYVCEFRFRAGELTLVPPDDGESDHDWAPLASHVGGQPVVPVTFDGVAAVACWDTGAGLTAVDADFAREHPGLVTPARAAVGVDSSGVRCPARSACWHRSLSAASLSTRAPAPSSIWWTEP